MVAWGGNGQAEPLQERLDHARQKLRQGQQMMQVIKSQSEEAVQEFLELDRLLGQIADATLRSRARRSLVAGLNRVADAQESSAAALGMLRDGLLPVLEIAEAELANCRGQR